MHYLPKLMLTIYILYLTFTTSVRCPFKRFKRFNILRERGENSLKKKNSVIMQMSVRRLTRQLKGYFGEKAGKSGAKTVIYEHYTDHK